jgi:hypothetical protein
MQNEIIHLKRNDNVVPQPKDARLIPPNFRDRVDRSKRNKEHRPRAP